MLDIGMEFRKGILFVRLKGVLNGDTSMQLDEELTSTIDNNGIKYLSINLSELKSIDKYGMKVLMKNYLNIRKQDGKVMICGLDKLLDYNGMLLNNLYKIPEESKAFEVITI